MAKGEELSSTQVTKAHLANIIKILCNKLKWNEEPEEEQNFENQVENDTNESTKVNEDEESNSNVNTERKDSEKTCKFFKVGKCKHGKSGKSCNFKQSAFFSNTLHYSKSKSSYLL